MLTDTQIDAGEARLDSGTKLLKDDDVMKTVAVLRMFLGSLETIYSYDYESKLRALVDTDAATGRKASQVAACLIEMEDLGFPTAALLGGRDGLQYAEKDDYGNYVYIIFSQLYPIPDELSKWPLGRRRLNRTSSAICSRRILTCP